jgi:hypothetical protein
MKQYLVIYDVQGNSMHDPSTGIIEVIPAKDEDEIKQIVKRRFGYAKIS